ncbi:MAG: outer membrane beta-barrel protein, partial [Ginsengibacter sp.]
FESKYEFRNKKRVFDISPSFNINNSQSSSSEQSSSSGSNQGLQSVNNTYSQNNIDSKNITFDAGYINTGSFDQTVKRPKNYQVNYTFYAGSSGNQQWNKTAFRSVKDSTQNKNFDRRYNKNFNDINQTLFLQLNDLKSLIFRNKNLAGFDFQFQNNFYLNTHNENNMVTDKDSLSKLYLLNDYLTNKSANNTFNDKPALNFNKWFMKSLANRYQKTVFIQALAESQFYHLKNTSEKSFQNLEYNYLKFIPSASINYTNYQYGDHQMSMSINYKASSDYPNVDQLAPLTDSSNVYYIQKGTGNLKPDYKHEVSLTFQNSIMKSKNVFFYSLYINAGVINNNMMDSSIYDNLGRSIHYTVNANGNKYASAMGNLNKAFKFKENQLQLSAMTNFNIAKNPNYVNSVLIMSNSFTNNTNVNLHYRLKDFLVISLGENLSFFHSIQNASNKNEFKNSRKSTTFSTSINFTKKLTLSSNITYNRNTSSGSSSIDFTIWNASTQYRFLKGNNAEIKLSALDLLHQNTSIINYGSNNYLARGTVNVLQQYFMVTFSYFPRKFGKEKN